MAGASVATLQFASGALATLASTCLAGWRHRVGLHVVCDGLVVELSETELVATVPDRVSYRATGDALRAEDRAFVDAVRGLGDDVRVPYAEALRSHRVACAAARSAVLNQPVRLAPDRSAP